jgi:hypothetical protein
MDSGPRGRNEEVVIPGAAQPEAVRCRPGIAALYDTDPKISAVEISFPRLPDSNWDFARSVENWLPPLPGTAPSFRICKKNCLGLCDSIVPPDLPGQRQDLT